MRLTEIKGDDFWGYQAEVIPEEDITAKIHRRVEIRSRPSFLDFDHISEQENRLLDTYELIQFFHLEKHQIIPILLYPQPTKEAIGEVMQEKTPNFQVWFNKIGQAQLWYSKTTKKCILWECYLWTDLVLWRNEEEAMQRVKKIWKWLLEYIKTSLQMKEIYTHDFDPAYGAEEYPKLLSGLGFKTTEKPNVMLLEAQ